MRPASKRVLVVAVTAVVLAASALVSTRLRLDEDVTALLPDTDATIRDYRYVMKRFKALDTLYIDVGAQADKPLSEKDVTGVADALYGRLRGSGMFSMIHYRTSPEHFLALLDAMSERKGRLFSAGDISTVEARLTPASVESRLAAAHKALIDPSGVFTRERIQRDPLGLDELLVAKLKTLAGESSGAEVIDGRIWSSDRRHVLMIAMPTCSSMDMPQNEKLNALLDNARAESLAAAPQGTVRVSYVGGHRASLDNARTIKADVAIAMTISSIGILLLAVFFFRRAVYVPLMLLPPVFGLACATLLYGIVDPAISAISIGVSAVLLGITVDCAVHIFYRIDNTSDEKSPYATVRTMLLPLAMVSGTTVAALLCLLFSSLPGQRQTAIFATVSVLGANLYAVLALPSLLPAQHRQRRWHVVPLADYCKRLLEWRARHATASALFIAALLAVSAFGLRHLEFEGNADALNYLTPADRADMGVVHDAWGDFSSTVAVVRGKTLEEALEANDRLFEVLNRLEKEGRVTAVSSIAFIRPSEKTQLDNASRWNGFWSPQRRASLRATMRNSLAAYSFSPKAFEPFYAALDSSAAGPSAGEFAGTGLDDLVSSRIARDGDNCLLMSVFSPAPGYTFDGTRDAIIAALPGTMVANGRRFVERSAEIARHELKTLAVIAAIAVAVCLLLLLGRLELVAVCLIPVLLSVAMTLGALGLLGIRINVVSSLFVVFVFGVGIDYSIFLLSSSLEAFRGGHEAGAVAFGSVIISVLSTLCSFAVLSFARHPALYAIGITGTIGMLSSLLCAALVVPPVAAAMLPAKKRLGSPTLLTMAGGLCVLVYLISSWLFYSCCLRFVAMALYPRDLKARRRLVRRYIHLVAYCLMTYYPYRSSDRLWINVAPERFRTPAVIVSNHLAAVDIMSILALPVDQVMVVKQWVWDAPLVGLMARDAGYILTRSDDFEEILAQARGLLDDGVSVMIFPEGSRSRDIRMRRFHMGAFEIAVRTGHDVLPVLLTGTQICTPHGAFWVGEHRIVVRVFDRVTRETFDYSQGARPLASRVKRQMLEVQAGDWRLSQQGRAFRIGIRDLYNYLGPYVENYVAWKLRLDPIYRVVDSLVPLKGDVVDLGCGYGIMSNVLARKSMDRRVVGVDYDERKIAVAQRTFIETSNASFECADIVSWICPASDAIVLIDVLHYWPEDVQRRIIASAAGALRPGGTLVFRDAFATDETKHRVTSWFEVFSTSTGHNRAGGTLHFRGRDFYVDAFRKAGLSLHQEVAEAAIGSNVALVLKKDRDAV